MLTCYANGQAAHQDDQNDSVTLPTRVREAGYGPARNLLPRPGPNPKIVNFMAPTPDWPNYFLPGPKRFIVNLKLSVYFL